MVDFKRKIYKAIDIALRCLYPKHCPVCDEIIPINEEYCACSRKENRRLGDNCCIHCGRENSSCVCEARNSVYLPEIAGVYIYDGKVRADILELKFYNRKNLAVRLGTDMAERCAKVYSDVDFDIVTFVPMSKESLEYRMYNQSELLANQVGKMLFVPVEDLFVKIKNTQAQHSLNGEDRLENVRDSVSVKSDINVEGKTVLICDDVKTTGATLSQCVKALESAGASRICCICIALSNFSL